MNLSEEDLKRFIFLLRHNNPICIFVNKLKRCNMRNEAKNLLLLEFEIKFCFAQQ